MRARMTQWARPQLTLVEPILPTMAASLNSGVMGKPKLVGSFQMPYTR